MAIRVLCQKAVGVFARGVFILLLAALASAGAGALAQLPVNVTVTLDPEHPGAQIPADFVGLSFEMQTVLAATNGSHFFSPSNTKLIDTFRTLGIKSLRVGGNTADRPGLPVPTTADADALFAFAKAAHVKVIYTLRLNHGDPAAAAAMARYISRHYARQLDCFAIGNEPNVFSTNFDSYLAEWKRFAAQITAPAQAPAARFCGPGVSPGHEKWSAQFATALASTVLLKYVSQHDYAGGDARKVTNPAAARDKILSGSMETHYAKFAANFVPAVQAQGLGYRFEEANSFYDGGALDVSDSFASALWALNYQWWWAAHGLSGINFHTGDKVAARDENKPCRYATFWTTNDGYNVHPIGYAEKMFSLGSRGRFIPATVSAAGGTNSDFAAYAVAGDDGALYATFINFSHGATAASDAVQLAGGQGTHWRSAQILRFTAPDGDVAAKTGITLGGAPITDDARWPGRWETLPRAADSPETPTVVELPAASAAIVKLK
jgi:hypothetical protein